MDGILQIQLSEEGADAEFERELISERTIAGLASARARGRTGGRPFTMTPAKVRLAMASMGKPGEVRVVICCWGCLASGFHGGGDTRG